MKSEPNPKVWLYRRLVQAKLFINTHYSEKIDVDNIADETYCSKVHFIRLFKKVYGKTPHQYLTFVRLQKARQQLKTNIAIADVCYHVGFDSISSFTGLFKRTVGLAPSAYQRQQLHIKNDLHQTPLKYIPGCIASKWGLEKKSNFEEASS